MPINNPYNKKNEIYYYERAELFKWLAISSLVAPFLIILFTQDIITEFWCYMLAVIFAVPFLICTEFCKIAYNNLEDFKKRSFEQEKNE
ncbi:hypothetical protein [Chryseobacterium sp.]|uniref:hypothetical protein n=1 Tax=Chryseobacterium sp. TaxID=1871047 RepID=UPI00289E6E68|nr:hypothetical protein [Chryseobacterium sp.]